MTKKEREVERLINREIPTPSLDSFESPNLSTVNRIQKRDLMKIEKIYNDLVNNGLVDIETDETFTPINSFKESFDDAISRAKSEKELNPDYYDEALDKTLRKDLSFDEDWDNPILDGKDDYGTQVFEDHSAPPGNKNFTIKVMLEVKDGKIVSSKII